MNHKHLATCVGDGSDEVTHKVVAFDFVNADPVFDGDRHGHHICHGLDAIGHQCGLVHQTCAESAALHAFARAAAIEINLVIAPLLAQACAVRQIGRLRATQLQCHRMFFGLKPQMASHIAMHQSSGCYHFGV